jgi:hypothetical protein
MTRTGPTSINDLTKTDRRACLSPAAPFTRHSGIVLGQFWILVHDLGFSQSESLRSQSIESYAYYTELP